MTLENIASVTAGQIMTRVTADKDAGEQVCRKCSGASS